MLEATKRYELDGILLSSLDRKWSSTSREQITRKFRRISKEVEILTSDSGKETRTAHRYLPGGTFSVLLG